MKKLYLLALIALTLIFIYSCDESTAPISDNYIELPAELIALYDSPPDGDNCFEGVLKMSEKLKALDRLNYFRAIHGLPSVNYNTAEDENVQKSALISVVNEMLNHYPDDTVKCYSRAGDTACQHSNLHISFSSGFSSPWNSSMSIDGWISEQYSTSIGHRRWFLSPFLKTVSFGRVDQIKKNGYYFVGTTMHVWNVSGASSSDAEFVACPFHDYPNTAFETGLILSFSAIYDNSAQHKNSNVIYDDATVQVLDESTKSYSITDKQFDNKGYGVPNSLEWKTKGLEYNKKYTVKINNVKVNGTTKNYEYWFKLTN